MDIIHLILYFAVYSIVGWVYESTLCSITQKGLVNRGFLNGPLCPVYGFGACAVIFFIFGKTQSIPLIFIASVLLTCTIEYIASFMLEKFFHAKWWDYSNFPLNIHGRICIYGALVFGTLSVLLITCVHPFTISVIAMIPPVWQITAAIALLAAIMLDLYFTVKHMLGLNNRLQEIQNAFNDFTEQHARGLKERFALRFEESDYYSERIHNFLNKPRFQSVRLMKAFPKLRSIEYEDALKKLKEHLLPVIKK